MTKRIAIPHEEVVSKIYWVRGHKVMLDHELADLYCVQTKVLNQAGMRNTQRFPGDFMFRLSESEFKNLRSQSVTSSWGGRRTPPYAFTELGVSMLSSVLTSERAVLINIYIMRAFARMRTTLMTHKDILLKLEQLERKVVGHNSDIKVIFEHLRDLLNPKTQPIRKIGFKQQTS